MLRTYRIEDKKGNWLNNYQIVCSNGETKDQTFKRVISDLIHGKVGHWEHQLGKIDFEKVGKIVLTYTEK